MAMDPNAPPRIRDGVLFPAYDYSRLQTQANGTAASQRNAQRAPSRPGTASSSSASSFPNGSQHESTGSGGATRGGREGHQNRQHRRGRRGHQPLVQVNGNGNIIIKHLCMSGRDAGLIGAVGGRHRSDTRYTSDAHRRPFPLEMVMPLAPTPPPLMHLGNPGGAVPDVQPPPRYEERPPQVPAAPAQPSAPTPSMPVSAANPRRTPSVSANTPQQQSLRAGGPSRGPGLQPRVSSAGSSRSSASSSDPSGRGPATSNLSANGFQQTTERDEVESPSGFRSASQSPLPAPAALRAGLLPSFTSQDRVRALTAGPENGETSYHGHRRLSAPRKSPGTPLRSSTTKPSSSRASPQYGPAPGVSTDLRPRPILTEAARSSLPGRETSFENSPLSHVYPEDTHNTFQNPFNHGQRPASNATGRRNSHPLATVQPKTQVWTTKKPPGVPAEDIIGPITGILITQSSLDRGVSWTPFWQDRGAAIPHGWAAAPPGYLISNFESHRRVLGRRANGGSDHDEGQGPAGYQSGRR